MMRLARHGVLAREMTIARNDLVTKHVRKINRLGYRVVHWRIILKWMLKNSAGSELGPVLVTEEPSFLTNQMHKASVNENIPYACLH